METDNKFENVEMLTDEALEIVTGGAGKGGAATRTIGDCVFSGHVDKYSGQPHCRYFITEDQRDYWYMGVMLDTWEASAGFGTTQRKHKFSIMLFNGGNYFKTMEFYGDKVTLYTTCNKYP